MRSFICSCVLIGLLACGDDTSSSGGGGSGASAQGGGGEGGIAGAGGLGGSGGTGGTGAAGGAQPMCDVLAVTDMLLEECMGTQTFGAPRAATTICAEDSSVFWPAVVFTVPVPGGACVEIAADNIGSPLGADLFASIVDPSGASLYYDEEMPCTVPNPSGFMCPRGAVTTIETGNAYIVVGAWEGDGCVPLEDTPFELSVVIDGVDVDLMASPVCAGDLLTIIP